MSDLDVGKRATYYSEYGDLVCWITDYSPGKDQGDHRVAGFNNDAARDDGQGDVFSAWSVVTTTGEQGGIRVH